MLINAGAEAGKLPDCFLNKAWNVILRLELCRPADTTVAYHHGQNWTRTISNDLGASVVVDVAVGCNPIKIKKTGVSSRVWPTGAGPNFLSLGAASWSLARLDVHLPRCHWR